MTTIDIRELPARLDEMLALANDGSEVTLTDAGVPLMRLAPCIPQLPRVADLHSGSFQPADDFDEPLTEDCLFGTKCARVEAAGSQP